MLELVVGQFAGLLAVVPLGDEVEVGLVVVARESLVDDLPRDRMPVLDRGETVPQPRRIGAVAAERPELLAAVRVAQANAVAGRLGARPGRLCFGLDALDEPPSAFQPEHLAGLQRLVRRVPVDPFSSLTR